MGVAVPENDVLDEDLTRDRRLSLGVCGVREVLIASVRLFKARLIISVASTILPRVPNVS